MALSDISSSIDLINSAQSFGLIAHHNPDGDALGSALGMAHLMRAAGKDVCVSWPDEFGPSRERYSFLPGIETAVPSGEFIPGDVVISFDCASLQRLRELGTHFDGRKSIVIDHHFSNSGFGTFNIVDVDAAATAVVVRDLARDLGWNLNRDAAHCLYTGLMTDTGRFQYSNTNAKVFDLARELAEFDLPIAELSREMFEKDRFAVIKFTAELINRAQLDESLGLVWSYVREEDLKLFGVERIELEGAIEVLRRTSEAEVSCLLRSYDGETHGSLRAISQVDVSAIAKQLGGGGHRLAAGFSTNKSIDDVISFVKSELAKTKN